MENLKEGYIGDIELPHNIKLKDAVNLEFWEPEVQIVQITHTDFWNLKN